MARIPNKLPTVKLPISTNPAVIRYLTALVPTGLYGKNETEAAERLLTRAIEALIKDGVLERVPATLEDKSTQKVKTAKSGSRS